MISDEEIMFMAQKYHKTFDEMKNDIEIFVKELKETNQGIEDTIIKNGYLRFPADLDIYGYGKNGELNDKYLCYTPNIPKILEKDKKDIGIVSGFGATNTPTVGTLSVILKLIELQNKTDLYTYCIVSDLGSMNARNIDIKKVLDLTEKFKEFIVKMGFNTKNGEIRTHNDLDHARTFSIIARALCLNDFLSNGEATDDTYKRLNLKGNDFSVLVDHVYTAADVMLPIFRDGKSGIIVPCGLEEYYHTNIGGIAFERLMQDESIKELIPKDVMIGNLYSKLIKGFYPYFKQSKSIPNSSVNLGNTKDEIVDKIINCSNRDEEVILDMITLASNYSKEKINIAIDAFKNRDRDYKRWYEIKKEYIDYFMSIKETWDSCSESNLCLKKKLYR